MSTPSPEMPIRDTPVRLELNTRITPDLLRQVRGRPEQYEMFTAMYPEGVEVTREWCIKHADLFDFRWAARHLLTDEGCSYFWGPAQVAYRSRRLRGDPSYATKLAETFAATVQQFGLAEDPR